MGMAEDESGKSLLACGRRLQKRTRRHGHMDPAAVDRRRPGGDRGFAMQGQAQNPVAGTDPGRLVEGKGRLARKSANVAVETAEHSRKLQIEGGIEGREELGKLAGGGNGEGEFGRQYGAIVNVDKVMTQLARRGIETRPFFWPMHRQPVFCRMGLFLGITCPVADRLGQRGFYLPSGLTISDEQIEYVAKTFREALH